MAKKDNLPKTVEADNQSASSIVYAGEVVATIAGVAASEVEGVAEMCNVSGSFLGKNRNLTKGVKVEVGPEEVSVDLYIIVEYERPMHKVAQEIQENVRKAIESMTSLHVVRVDVHVQGVSFEKQNTAAEEAKKAALPGAEKPAKGRKKAAKPQEPAPEPEQAQAEQPEKPYTVEITDEPTEEKAE